MLKEILSNVSRKMQIDFNGITSQIQHNGEKGNAREATLINFLESYMPDKYCFAKGEIVDCNDEHSKQVDIIIHDKFLTPYLVNLDGTKIIPIESVYSVIEVKSTLTKEELRKSIKNVESVRKLEKRTISGFSCPTAGMLFAFDSDVSLDAIYKNLNELSINMETRNKISCICVLNKGVIFPINKIGLQQISLLPDKNTVYGMFDNTEDALLLFYLFLLQTLNSILISPPDMVAYAQSSEMLNTSFCIPKDYIPADATVNIMDNLVSMSEIMTLKDAGASLLSGKLNKEEFISKIFETYIPTLQMMHGSLNLVPSDSELNYFGTIISCKKIIEAYNIFNKGINITDDEEKFFDEIMGFMYVIYDEHRDEMQKKNSQMC